MPQSISPSSSPPPPTSSGAIYIVAVIALIAAIGGLVCWKLKGTKDEAPAPVATAPTSTGPTLAEPPPPPPPIEEDAGGGAGGAKMVTGTANPCGGKCNGSAGAALQSAITGRAGAARPCYERALRVNSTLQGKLMVNVRIDPQGNVCSSSVAQDQIHSAEVANCVLGMFRSAKFPPPTGGCTEVNVPLSFVPREGK